MCDLYMTEASSKESGFLDPIIPDYLSIDLQGYFEESEGPLP